MWIRGCRPVQWKTPGSTSCIAATLPACTDRQSRTPSGQTTWRRVTADGDTSLQSLLACTHEIVPARKPETRHTSIRQGLQPTVDANAPLLTQNGSAKEGARTGADGPPRHRLQSALREHPVDARGKVQAGTDTAASPAQAESRRPERG